MFRAGGIGGWCFVDVRLVGGGCCSALRRLGVLIAAGLCKYNRCAIPEGMGDYMVIG